MSLRHVRKVYASPVRSGGQGGPKVALQDITFDVARGEFACVVGPSGAGKTTLLRTLAGLAQPTSGEALFEGAPLRSVPPGIGVVFQDYGRSLYPWLTVARNVDLPLRVRGVPRAERAQRVAEVLGSVGLADAAGATRGSCRAACSSGWRSPGRLPTGPTCCSWTSRSRRWTRRPASSSRT